MEHISEEIVWLPFFSQMVYKCPLLCRKNNSFNLNSVWFFTFGIHKTIKLGVGNFFKLVVKILLDNE